MTNSDYMVVDNELRIVGYYDNLPTICRLLQKTEGMDISVSNLRELLKEEAPITLGGFRIYASHHLDAVISR